MWKAPSSVLCGCLAALPLIGCAGDVTTARQSATVTPVVLADSAPYYSAGPRVNTAGVAAPAAILVFLPPNGVAGGGDFLPRDPPLWTAQGFGGVMSQPDIYRLVADQQAVLARLVASAQALEAAPIWLVGSSPAIDPALATEPPFERGGVSGVLVTSITSNSGSCSESVFYSDPGTGAAPKVEVKKSGNCEAGLPAINQRQPSILPAPRGKAPRLIEASAAPENLPAAARVQHLAQLIKAPPSS